MAGRAEVAGTTARGPRGVESPSGPEGRGRRRGRATGLLLAAALLLSGAPAIADEYDPPNAGHPLRIVGYALHPVGVVYDYLLLRPAYWVGSHQPFRTLFGRTD